MKMETDCGVFLIDRETNKLLICKFTQTNTWSIPKGPCASGEPYFSTAIRQLYEETGISYNELSVEKALEYEQVKETETHILKVFVVYIDEDVSQYKMKCRKRQGKQPAVIEYKWTSIEDAFCLLNPCQVAILKSL
jgi:ADP-ribose pyrophosphatase YjhB (NUDIX family)